jgi:hypothetical protein
VREDAERPRGETGTKKGYPSHTRLTISDVPILFGTIIAWRLSIAK